LLLLTVMAPAPAASAAMEPPLLTMTFPALPVPLAPEGSVPVVRAFVVAVVIVVSAKACPESKATVAADSIKRCLLKCNLLRLCARRENVRPWHCPSFGVAWFSPDNR